MIYIEYEQLKQKLYFAQKDYDNLLQEKEALFAMTQPNSPALDKEKVSGGNPVNSFDKYLVRKERTRIEERLAEARIILADRRLLTAIKQDELEKSENIYDRVYCLKYIKRYKIQKIARELNYSDRQIKRYLKQIRTRLGIERTNEAEI